MSSASLGGAYVPDGGARSDVERSANEKDMFASSYLLRPKLVGEGGEPVTGVEVRMVACCGRTGMVVAEVEPDWGSGFFHDDDDIDDVPEPFLGVTAL